MANPTSMQNLDPADLALSISGLLQSHLKALDTLYEACPGAAFAQQIMWSRETVGLVSQTILGPHVAGTKRLTRGQLEKLLDAVGKSTGRTMRAAQEHIQEIKHASSAKGTEDKMNATPAQIQEQKEAEAQAQAQVQADAESQAEAEAEAQEQAQQDDQDAQNGQ